MANRKNRRPGYATGPDYDRIPKAVWADIAMSFALILTGEEGWPKAVQEIAGEWCRLHANGIVEMPPPKQPLDL